MSDVNPIGDVLVSSLMSVNDEMRVKMRLYEIIKHWDEIAGELSEKISPAQFENGILTLQSNDNTIKDSVKYLAAEFIDRINAKIGNGEQIVVKIDFGKTFQKPHKKLRAVVTETPKVYDIDKVELTAAEIAECERKVDAVENVANRQIMLETLLNRAKYDKLKLRDGWHKCQLCDVLCKPHENLCGYCRVKEREKLQAAIRKIFVDAPHTSFRDIQTQMLAEFPHLRGECTAEFIEAVRMELILRRAALVSYGDTTSERARALVMLIRQLPEEKLSDAIILRTLKEFRFNLADQPPFEERTFAKSKSKLQKVSRRNIEP